MISARPIWPYNMCVQQITSAREGHYIRLRQKWLEEMRFSDMYSVRDCTLKPERTCSYTTYNGKACGNACAVFLFSWLPHSNHEETSLSKCHAQNCQTASVWTPRRGTRKAVVLPTMPKANVHIIYSLQTRCFIRLCSTSQRRSCIGKYSASITRSPRTRPPL